MYILICLHYLLDDLTKIAHNSVRLHQRVVLVSWLKFSGLHEYPLHAHVLSTFDVYYIRLYSVAFYIDYFQTHPRSNRRQS